MPWALKRNRYRRLAVSRVNAACGLSLLDGLRVDAACMWRCTQGMGAPTVWASQAPGDAGCACGCTPACHERRRESRCRPALYLSRLPAAIDALRTPFLFAWLSISIDCKPRWKIVYIVEVPTFSTNFVIWTQIWRWRFQQWRWCHPN